MGRKAKAKKNALAAAEHHDEASAHAGTKDLDDTVTAASGRKTFTAASGKFFATACDEYPESDEIHPDLGPHIVSARDGDLLEVLYLRGDWAFGRRFKPKDGTVNEGVFRLDWVHGVKLLFESGKRVPVEVDIRSDDYGFREPVAKDTAGKLQIVRRRRSIEDAVSIWDRLEGEAEAEARTNAAATTAKRAEAALVKEEANVKARNDAEERRRQAILDEVRRRKDEAEYAKRMAAKEEQRQEEEKLAAQRRRVEEAEESRRREIQALEQSARMRQEQRRQEDERNAQMRRAAEEERRKEDERNAQMQLAAQAEEIKKKEAREHDQHASLNVKVAAANADALSTTAESVAVSGSKLEQERDERKANQMLQQGRQFAWDSHWEQQACLLERVLSESSSGVESDGLSSPVQKKTVKRKFTASLLAAKRSGELHAIAEEWERVHEDMVSKSSDLIALEEKIDRGLFETARTGEDLERMVEEMTNEAEQKVAEVSELKKRVFHAMLNMRRSAVERSSYVDRRNAAEIKQLKARVFGAMMNMKQSDRKQGGKDSRSASNKATDALGEHDTKAIQLKNLMKRAFRGMVLESRRYSDECTGIQGMISGSDDDDAPPRRIALVDGVIGGRQEEHAVAESHAAACSTDEPKELEQLADQLVEQLQTKADSIKNKIRKGLLRAHRAGELLSLKEELAELADTVSHMGEQLCESSPVPTAANSPAPKQSSSSRAAPKRRWCEYTSESGSDVDVPQSVYTALLRHVPKPTARSNVDIITSPLRGASVGSDADTENSPEKGAPSVSRRWGSSGACNNSRREERNAFVWPTSVPKSTSSTLRADAPPFIPPMPTYGSRADDVD